MSKITDLIHHENFTYSYEITPDINKTLLDKLSVQPLFYSITWHAKLYNFSDLDIPPLKLAKLLKSKENNVLLHLSCDKLRRSYLNKLLQMLQENGITNLLIFHGEKYDESTSDFKTTQELISHIRNETGDYFCIGVVGFPDGSNSKLQHLKEKVDSGANFIITQAFFESHIYEDFIKSCRQLNIEIPVIPGIFSFDSHEKLVNFEKKVAIKVSENFKKYVKSRNNAQSVNHIVKDLINNLITRSNVHHFHFFTLNRLSENSDFISHLLAHDIKLDKTN